MPKTIQEHLKDSNQIKELIDDANALVKKLQSELAISRNTLEALREMQHPKVDMTVPYQLRGSNKDEKTTPAGVIQRQVERINALLGDRA